MRPAEHERGDARVIGAPSASRRPERGARARLRAVGGRSARPGAWRADVHLQLHAAEAVHLVAADEVAVAVRRQWHRRVAVAAGEDRVGRAAVLEPSRVDLVQGVVLGVLEHCDHDARTE